MAGYLDDTFGLRGKVALVTGSSQGLGLAMVRALARAGADVIVNGRDGSKLASVVREIATGGSQAHAIPADLASRADVTRLMPRRFAGAASSTSS